MLSATREEEIFRLVVRCEELTTGVKKEITLEIFPLSKPRPSLLLILVTPLTGGVNNWLRCLRGRTIGGLTSKNSTILIRGGLPLVNNWLIIIIPLSNNKIKSRRAKLIEIYTVTFAKVK